MKVFFQRFRRDIVGVIYLAAALFLALSLGSFRPSDPSFNSIGATSFSGAQNFCGYFGSFLADLLYQIWGLSAWIVAAVCLRLGWRSVHGRDVSFWNVRTAWGFLLLLTVSSLLGLHLPEARLFQMQIPVGGLLGILVSRGLVAVFNFVGVAIILWTCALLLLVFYTERSVKELLLVPKLFFLTMKEFSIAAPQRLQAFFRYMQPPEAAVAGANAGPSGGGRVKKALLAPLQRSTSSDMDLSTYKGAGSSLSAAKPEGPSFWSRLILGRRAIGDAGTGKGAAGAASAGAGETAVRLGQSGDEHRKKFLKSIEEVGRGDADEEIEAEDGGAVANPMVQMEMAIGDKLSTEKPSPDTPRRKVRLATKVERRIENWKLPELNMLEDPPATRVKVDEREIIRKSAVLTDKLAQFSVRGEVCGAKPGPAVTMYEFRPAADVKISKITELADDLSLALSSESVRIIAPIPGRDVVGIETSNSHRETVYLKDILATDAFWSDKTKLPIPMGRQADGEAKVEDLRKMPHLLVAGTTGSGKSVFVVSAITGLLFRHSPKTLRLILVDPKQVDLAAFSNVPHLLMPLIREPKKAVTALKWAIREMEKRYRSMSRFGARGIESFNEIVEKLNKDQLDQHEKFNEELELANHRLEQYYFTPQPYIVIVVEEFADLMAVDKVNVEQSVVRLAQMARACGIHLILAMQSPRKDVVTGLIKTNIPGRISFKVAAKMDSRIILDESGAERLLARGDMLFLAPGVSKPQRHHGPWVTEDEIASIMKFWSDQGEPQFDPLALRALEGTGGGFSFDSSSGGGGSGGSGSGSGDDGFGDGSGGGDGFDLDRLDGDADHDDRYDEILSWVSSQKEVSASLLQRKFRLGYPRAARMIEIFEREQVVGPANGSKPRQVLVKSYSSPER